MIDFLKGVWDSSGSADPFVQMLVLLATIIGVGISVVVFLTSVRESKKREKVRKPTYHLDFILVLISFVVHFFLMLPLVAIHSAFVGIVIGSFMALSQIVIAIAINLFNPLDLKDLGQKVPLWFPAVGGLYFLFASATNSAFYAVHRRVLDIEPRILLSNVVPKIVQEILASIYKANFQTPNYDFKPSFPLVGEEESEEPEVEEIAKKEDETEIIKKAKAEARVVAGVLWMGLLGAGYYFRATISASLGIF
jgi:hypothetical protein